MTDILSVLGEFARDLANNPFPEKVVVNAYIVKLVEGGHSEEEARCWLRNGFAGRADDRDYSRRLGEESAGEALTLTEVRLMSLLG